MPAKTVEIRVVKGAEHGMSGWQFRSDGNPIWTRRRVPVVEWYGCWCIHASPHSPRGEYTVTHASTGAAARSGLTLAKARKLAAALKAMPDQGRWRRRTNPNRLPKAMTTHGREVIASVLGADR
jgi:hypothetical protein